VAKTKRLKPEAPKTRVLLVDDHPMVRERLGQLINREPDLTVCGEADDGPEAMTAIEKTKPHLAIVDLTLRQSDGLELIKSLKTLHPKLPMLVLSMHDESVYAERALRAGAHGYITKQEATQKVMLAIRRVLSGQVYLSDRMSAQLLNKVTHQPKLSLMASLSDRELEVFRRVGQGQSSREIATSMHLGLKTVETYRARIKTKLGLKSSSMLVQQAVRWVQQEGRDTASH
jgi:DNA-binding NarL/FixJ family response regulator